MGVVGSPVGTDTDPIQQRSALIAASWLAAASWSLIASTIWLPTVRTGLRAFIAPWNTTASWVQRSWRSASGSSRARSTPSNQTAPPVMLPAGGNSRIAPMTAVVLPHPDSPTSPRTLPRRRSKLTSSTAVRVPAGVS